MIEWGWERQWDIQCLCKGAWKFLATFQQVCPQAPCLWTSYTIYVSIAHGTQMLPAPFCCKCQVIPTVRENSELSLEAQGRAILLPFKQLEIFFVLWVPHLQNEAGNRRTLSLDENCLGAVLGHGFFQTLALLTKAGWPLGFKIESITASSHTQTSKDTPHPGGEVQPGKIRPIITLIIYFSPSTPKSARGRSIIPFAFQSCNIYSKPEPLPVNVLSEERHSL